MAVLCMGVGVGVLAGYGAGVGQVPVPSTPAYAVAQQIPPCAQEDSVGPCYWDASLRGNGRGQSFTVDGSQTVHYWP